MPGAHFPRKLSVISAAQVSTPGPAMSIPEKASHIAINNASPRSQVFY